MKPKTNSQSRTIAKSIASIASDHKAIDVAVLDLRKLTSFTDYFVICSGASDRQVKAIAWAIHEKMKEKGHPPLGEEGLDAGHWALIDYGNVVAHVFYEDDREYYQLEKFWHDAPRVSIKGVTA